MSEIVVKEWRKLASSQKKRYIKDFIFMKPYLVNKVIGDYKATDVLIMEDHPTELIK